MAGWFGKRGTTAIVAILSTLLIPTTRNGTLDTLPDPPRANLGSNLVLINITNPTSYGNATSPTAGADSTTSSLTVRELVFWLFFILALAYCISGWLTTVYNALYALEKRLPLFVRRTYRCLSTAELILRVLDLQIFHTVKEALFDRSFLLRCLLTLALAFIIGLRDGNEFEEMKDGCIEAEKGLKDSITETAKAQAEVADLRRERDQMAQERMDARLKAEADSRAFELRKAALGVEHDKRLQALRTTITRLESDKKRLEVELSDRSHDSFAEFLENSNLRRMRCGSLNKERKLRSKIQKLENANGTKTNKITVLLRNIDDLKSENAVAQLTRDGELQKLTNTLSNTTATLKRLQQLQEAHDGVLATKDAKIQSIVGDMKSVSTLAGQQRREIKRLTSLLERCTADKAFLHSDVKAMERERQTLERERQTLERERQTLERECLTMVRKLEVLQKEHQVALADLEEFHDQYDAFCSMTGSEADILEQYWEFDALREENDRLTEKLSNLELEPHLSEMVETQADSKMINRNHAKAGVRGVCRLYDGVIRQKDQQITQLSGALQMLQVVCANLNAIIFNGTHQLQACNADYELAMEMVHGLEYEMMTKSVAFEMLMRHTHEAAEARFAELRDRIKTLQDAGLQPLPRSPLARSILQQVQRNIDSAAKYPLSKLLTEDDGDDGASQHGRVTEIEDVDEDEDEDDQSDSPPQEHKGGAGASSSAKGKLMKKDRDAQWALENPHFVLQQQLTGNKNKDKAIKRQKAIVMSVLFGAQPG